MSIKLDPSINEDGDMLLIKLANWVMPFGESSEVVLGVVVFVAIGELFVVV